MLPSPCKGLDNGQTDEVYENIVMLFFVNIRPLQVLEAIASRQLYNVLSPDLKKVVSNSMWKDCVRFQGYRNCESWTQQWHGSKEGGAIDAIVYYKGLVADHSERFAVFPHHMADVVVGHLRITPYEYYCNMLVELIRTERAYDALPNWTAADCNRVLGIGRNEYIVAMNQCKAKGWLWQKRKGMIRAFLPTAPLSHEIQPWWLTWTRRRSQDELMQVLRDERLPNPEAEILQRLHSTSPIEVASLNVGIIRCHFNADERHFNADQRHFNADSRHFDPI